MLLGLEKYWSKEYELEIEFNRFAIISICIIAVGCLGGLTAGLGGGKQHLPFDNAGSHNYDNLSPYIRSLPNEVDSHK